MSGRAVRNSRVSGLFRRVTQGGFVNLIGLTVAQDSGFVDLFETPAMRPGGPYYFSSMWYHFKRVGDLWVFTRRELLQAG